MKSKNKFYHLLEKESKKDKGNPRKWQIISGKELQPLPQSDDENDYDDDDSVSS